MIVSSTFFKKDFDVSKAELIGEGNFAQVYRIFDQDTQDYLAIRRVDRDLGESEDIEKEKTINEELRRVENEHILKIFDIIESETCIWYITEYCEGGSLWDALNSCVDNRMCEKDAVECISQVSKGVKELHNHRITHRDLKPENILLQTKYIPNKPIPVIKLADFGLSTKKIIMETIAGTKEYIAPEQARFHNYTNAVDVWSLGIIFDEILHGSPFYIGDNNKEVFQKIIKNPYKVRDESIRTSIQEFLVSLLKKKAYERPIIAAICQNLEKIMEEINKGKQEKVDSMIVSFEKKSTKGVSIIQEIKPDLKLETKEEKSNVLELPTNDMMLTPTPMKEFSSLEISPQNDKREEGTSLSSKREDKRQDERKNKSPFKRQNGRPELFKSNEDFETEISSVNTSSVREQQEQKEEKDKKYQKDQRFGKTTVALARREPEFRSAIREESRNPSTTLLTEQNEKSALQENSRISIHKVEKRKLLSLTSKNQEQTPNIIPIKEYMESVSKMKTELLESSLSVGSQREFILNSQLTVSEFPDRIEGEEILRKFRESYSFLNYLNNDSSYEISLVNGQNNLREERLRVEELLEKEREKIKKSFLLQMDKFVDHYVNKIIK